MSLHIGPAMELVVDGFGTGTGTIFVPSPGSTVLPSNVNEHARLTIVVELRVCKGRMSQDAGCNLYAYPTKT
jgi:hypothetical protein